MKKRYLLLMLGIVTLSSCATKYNIPETFDIHTELQSSYFEGDCRLATKFAKGQEELSRPAPINFNLEESNTIYLSNLEDFSSYTTYKGNEDIYNLKIKTTYYYKIDSLSKRAYSFSVSTTKVRNLYVDGLTNVRDLGGYTTIDNKVVNQGLIYRSSKLNADESLEILISEKGIKTLKDDLGVKTEIDLRKTRDNEQGGITSSPLGSEVAYYSIPMESSGNIMTLNKDVIKDFFAVLSDVNNYPIDVHCSIGTDRTGYVCFLINALLGVSEEDLMTDYLFSNFGEIGGSRTFTVINKYLEELSYYDGETLKDKTYNYLLEREISKETLDNIRNIMLADIA